MNAGTSYQWLLDHHRETAVYDSIRQLLGWDRRTYLPRAGSRHRAAQTATLAGILYKRRTDPQTGDMLDRVEQSDMVRDPLSDIAVNIREWRRSYDRARRVPESLAVELARASSESESAWETARPQNDWQGFLPHLDRLVKLKREEAAALAAGGELYDALIEQFEPGESAAGIQPIFQKLAGALADLLDRIRGSGRKPEPGILRCDAPPDRQKDLILHIASHIGYDLQGGRIDQSAHPFTSGMGPGDVRITTRYDETCILPALFSSIHETGHAIYYQGLPAVHWGTPRGSAVSMAVHESQSLMWENMVGRSTGFWKYFLPAVRERFPRLDAVSFRDFHFAVNEVRPGLIRVDADEVTYNLHIILRFELEKTLVGGELEPDGLPQAWNEKMRRYLGLTPPDFATGVMQDVHWSMGSIGYFPSYALGNVYAAQFYAKAARDLEDPERLFESGDFEPFVDWFRANVYAHGSRYLPRELVKEATGEELNPQYLIEYLNRKFGTLYGTNG
jgi:carboxypeptidase Taq